MTKYFHLGHRTYVALFLFLIAALASCTKPTSVGKDLISNLDKQELHYTDTLEVLTRSIKDDSLFSFNQSVQLLGSMDDPVIGHSYAGIFFQVRLPSNNIDLGTGVKLDSAILQLEYEGTYGDPESVHNINVYQMGESMSLADPYRAYENFIYNPVPVGRIDGFNPSSTDTTLFRIPLTQSFGELLVNQSGTVNFESNARFLEFMNGLYLAPDTSSGFSNSIMSIDLLSSATQLTLYYSNNLSDSLFIRLPINAGSAVNNYFNHTYTNSSIQQQITKQVETDSVVYMQGMSGLALSVRFPDLANLGPIRVIKAEVVVTRLPDFTDSTYASPQIVIPRLRLADSTLPYFTFTEDEEFTSAQGLYSIGGEVQQEMVNGVTYDRYRINLARELQQMVDANNFATPLYLKIVPSVSSPARLRVGGGNHGNPEYRLTLNLYYTKK